MLRAAGADVTPAFNSSCIASSTAALAINVSSVLLLGGCDSSTHQCPVGKGPPHLASPLWGSGSQQWNLQLAASSIALAPASALPAQPLQSGVHLLPVGIQALVSGLSQGACGDAVDATVAWALGASTAAPPASPPLQSDISHTIGPVGGARMSGSYGLSSSAGYAPPVDSALSRQIGFLQLVGWNFQDCSTAVPDIAGAFPDNWQLISSQILPPMQGGVISAGQRGAVCIAHCHFSGASAGPHASLLVAQSGGTLSISRSTFSDTHAAGDAAGLITARANSTVLGHKLGFAGHVSSSMAGVVSASESSLVLMSHSTANNATLLNGHGAVVQCADHSVCAWHDGTVSNSSSSGSGGAMAVDSASTMVVAQVTFSSTAAANSAGLSDFAAWSKLAQGALTSANLSRLAEALDAAPHGGAIAVGLQSTQTEQNCVLSVYGCTFRDSFAPVGGAISVRGTGSVATVAGVAVHGSASSQPIPMGSPDAPDLQAALLGFQLYPEVAGCVFAGGARTRVVTSRTQLHGCTAQLAGGAVVAMAGAQAFVGKDSLIASSVAGLMGGGACLAHGAETILVLAGSTVTGSRVLEVPFGSIIRLFPVFTFPDPSIGSVPVGGAIGLVASYLFVVDSTIHDSFAAAGGAAIAATRGAAVTLMDTQVSASRFKGTNAHGGALLIANSTLQLLGHTVVDDSAPDGGKNTNQGGVIAAGVALYNLLDIPDAIPVDSPTMLALPACPCVPGGPAWAKQHQVAFSSTLHTYDAGTCEVDVDGLVAAEGDATAAHMSPQISGSVNHDLTLITLGAPSGLGVVGAARITVNGSVCVDRPHMKAGLQDLLADAGNMSASLAANASRLYVPVERQASGLTAVSQVSRGFWDIPTHALVRTSELDFDLFWDESQPNPLVDRADLKVSVQDTHFLQGAVAPPWGLVVTNNSAGASGAGGGIGLRSFSFNPSNPSLPTVRFTAEHLLVHNNTVTADGGTGSFGAGIFVYGYASLQLRYSRVSSNRAKGGGNGAGLYLAFCSDWRHMWMHGLDVLNNSASLQGGGLQVPGLAVELQNFGDQCPKAVSADRSAFASDGTPLVPSDRRGMFDTKHFVSTITKPSLLIQYQADVHNPAVMVPAGLRVPFSDGWPVPGNCSVLFVNPNISDAWFPTQKCAKEFFWDVDLVRDGSDARVVFHGNDAGLQGGAPTGAGGAISIHLAAGFTAQFSSGLLPDLPLHELLTSPFALRILSSLRMEDLRPAFWATLHSPGAILQPHQVPSHMHKYKQQLQYDPLVVQAAYALSNATGGQARAPALDNLAGWSPQQILLDFSPVNGVFPQGIEAAGDARQILDEAISRTDYFDFSRWVHSAMMHDPLSPTQERLLFAEASLLAWAPGQQWNVSHAQRRKLAAFFGATMFSDRYSVRNDPSGRLIPTMMTFDEWLPLAEDGDIFTHSLGYRPLRYRTRVVSMSMMTRSTQGAWPLVIPAAVLSHNSAGQIAGGIGAFQNVFRFDGCLLRNQQAQSEAQFFSVESGLQFFNSFIEDGSANQRGVGGGRTNGQLVQNLRDPLISNSVFRRSQSLSGSSVLDLEEEGSLNFTLITDGRGGGAAMNVEARPRGSTRHTICIGCLISRCSSQLDQQAGGLNLFSVLTNGGNGGWVFDEMVFTRNWNTQQLGQGGALRCSATARSGQSLFRLDMSNTVGGGNLAQLGGMIMLNTMCDLQAANLSCSYGTMVGDRQAQETIGASIGSCLLLFAPGPVAATFSGQSSFIGNSHNAVVVSSAQHFEITGRMRFATNSVALGIQLAPVIAQLYGSIDFFLNGGSTLPSSIDCRAPGGLVRAERNAQLRFFAPALPALTGLRAGLPIEYRASDGGALFFENTCKFHVEPGALINAQALSLYFRRVAFMTVRLQSAVIVRGGATMLIGGCQVNADVPCTFVGQESSITFEPNSTLIVSNAEATGLDAVTGAFLVSGTGSSLTMQDASLLVFNTSMTRGVQTQTREQQPQAFGTAGGGFLSVVQGAVVRIDVSHAAALRGPPAMPAHIVSQIMSKEDICKLHNTMCGDGEWTPSAWNTFLSLSASIAVDGSQLHPRQVQLSLQQVHAEIARGHSNQALSGGVVHVNSGATVHIGCSECMEGSAPPSMNTSSIWQGADSTPSYSAPTISPISALHNCSVDGSGIFIGASAAAQPAGSGVVAHYVIISHSSATGGRGGGVVACEDCAGVEVYGVAAHRIAVVRGGGVLAAQDSSRVSLGMADVTGSIVGGGGGVWNTSGLTGRNTLRIVSFSNGTVLGSGGLAAVSRTESLAVTTVCLTSTTVTAEPVFEQLKPGADTSENIGRGALIFARGVQRLVVDSTGSQLAVQQHVNATSDGERRALVEAGGATQRQLQAGLGVVFSQPMQACLGSMQAARAASQPSHFAAAVSHSTIASEGGLWYIHSSGSIVCPSALRPRDLLSYSALSKLASPDLLQAGFDVQGDLRALFQSVLPAANRTAFTHSASTAVQGLELGSSACVAAAFDVQAVGAPLLGENITSVGGGAVSQDGFALWHNLHIEQTSARTSAGIRIRSCGGGVDEQFPLKLPVPAAGSGGIADPTMIPEAVRGSCTLVNALIKDTVALCDRSGLDVQGGIASEGFSHAITVYDIRTENVKAFREKGEVYSCIGAFAPHYTQGVWPMAFGTAAANTAGTPDLCAGENAVSTWYVDPNTTSVSTGGCCGSKSAPCITIQAAVSNAPDGGVISLAPAQYKVGALAAASTLNAFNDAPVQITGLEFMRDSFLPQLPPSWPSAVAGSAERWVPLLTPLLVAGMPAGADEIVQALLKSSAKLTSNAVYALCTAGEVLYGPVPMILPGDSTSNGASLWFPAGAFHMAVALAGEQRLNFSAAALLPACQGLLNWDGWLIPLQQAQVELTDLGPIDPMRVTLGREATSLEHIVLNSSSAVKLIDVQAMGAGLSSCVLAAPEALLWLAAAGAKVQDSLFVHQPAVQGAATTQSMIHMNGNSSLQLDRCTFVGGGSAQPRALEGGVLRVSSAPVTLSSIVSLGMSAAIGGSIFGTEAARLNFTGSLVAVGSAAASALAPSVAYPTARQPLTTQAIREWASDLFGARQSDACAGPGLSDINRGGFLSLSAESTARFELDGSTHAVVGGCAQLGGALHIADASAVHIVTVGNDPNASVSPLVLGGNTAVAGGAMYSTSQSQISIASKRNTVHLHVIGNSAVRGGGGFFERSIWRVTHTEAMDGARLTSAADEWRHLHAAGSSAGQCTVAAEQSTAACRDSPVLVSMEANQASAEGGGLFFLTSTLDGAGVCLSRNTASRGGGIASLLSQVFLNHSSFVNNVAVGSGGGGAFITSDTVSLRSVAVRGNKAGGSGGGLSLDLPASTHVRDMLASCNSASSGSGGAISLAAATGLTVLFQGFAVFSGNSAGMSGGALYFSSAAPSNAAAASSLAIVAARLLQQHPTNGTTALRALAPWLAAPAAGGDTAVSAAAATLKVVLVDDLFVAFNSAQGAGGGLACSFSSVVVQAEGNSAFTRNSATVGGAVSLDQSCSMYVVGTDLTLNSAQTAAAAIAVCPTCSLITSDSVIAGNCASMPPPGSNGASACDGGETATGLTVAAVSDSLQQGLTGAFIGAVRTGGGTCSLTLVRNTSVTDNPSGGLVSTGEGFPNAACLQGVRAALGAYTRGPAIGGILQSSQAEKLLGRTSMQLPGSRLRSNRVSLQGPSRRVLAPRHAQSGSADGAVAGSMLANLLWSGQVQPQSIIEQVNGDVTVEPLPSHLQQLAASDAEAGVQLPPAMLRLFSSQGAPAAALPGTQAEFSLAINIAPGSTVPQSAAPIVQVVDSAGVPVLQVQGGSAAKAASLKVEVFSTMENLDIGGSTSFPVDPVTGVAVLTGMLLRASAGSVSSIRLQLSGLGADNVPAITLKAQLLPCEAGSGLLASGSCGACDPGTASARDQSSRCLQCPAGAAVAGTGAGSDTSAGGADRCFACQLGLHAPTTGLGLCLSCFDGSFSAPLLLPDQRSAGASGASQLVLARGATRCISCPSRGVRCSSTGLALEAGYFFPQLARATEWQAKAPPGLPSHELLAAVRRGSLQANSSTLASNGSLSLLQDGVLVSAERGLQDSVYMLKVSSLLQNTQTAVYPCWLPSTCIIDSDNLAMTCAEGYTGPLCGVCDSDSGHGYVRDGSNCIQCLSPEGTWALAAVTLAGIIGILGYVTIFHEFGDTSSQKVMIRVLLSHVQLLSAQSLLQLEGLQLVRSFFGVTSIASGSVSQLPQFSCLFPDFGTGYYLAIASPFILAAIAVIVQLAAALWFSRCGQRMKLVVRHSPAAAVSTSTPDKQALRAASTGSKLAVAEFGSRRPSHAARAALQARTPLLQRWAAVARKRCAAAFVPPERLMTLQRFFSGSYVPPVVFLLFLSYSSFVRATMAAFSCTVEVEGEQYLRADLRVTCGSSEHQTMVIIGTVLMLAGGVGAPLLFGYILYSNRARLNDPAMVSQFSFLYDGYSFDDGMYMWEMQILLLRKFLLVACAQLVSDPGLQLMSAILVVGASFFLTVAFLPYESAMANNLELISLGTALLTLVLSMSLLGTADLQTEEVDASGAAGLTREEADSVSSIMTVLLLMLNIGVLLFLVFHVVYPPDDVSTSHVLKTSAGGRTGIAALMKRGLTPGSSRELQSPTPKPRAATKVAEVSSLRQNRVQGTLTSGHRLATGKEADSKQGFELPQIRTSAGKSAQNAMVMNPLVRSIVTRSPAKESGAAKPTAGASESNDAGADTAITVTPGDDQAQEDDKQPTPTWRKRRKSLFRGSVGHKRSATVSSPAAAGGGRG